MSFFKRFGYYLGGFSIGLIILAFFLSGKKVSCDYGPSARVKKNIRLKQLQYSNSVEEKIINDNLDSLVIKEILKNGEVIFSESDTKLDSCKIYVIQESIKKLTYKITVENCSTIATINKIEKKAQ